jgi:hypothetical protein
MRRLGGGRQGRRFGPNRSDLRVAPKHAISQRGETVEQCIDDRAAARAGPQVLVRHDPQPGCWFARMRTSHGSGRAVGTRHMSMPIRRGWQRVARGRYRPQGEGGAVEGRELLHNGANRRGFAMVQAKIGRTGPVPGEVYAVISRLPPVLFLPQASPADARGMTTVRRRRSAHSLGHQGRLLACCNLVGSYS